MASTGQEGRGGWALRRTVLSPFLAVLFVAVGTSGTLMLLDVAPDALEELHEWVGVGFVVVAVLHVLFNGRALLGYLRSAPAVVALVAAIGVCGVLVVVGGDGDDDTEEHKEKGDSDGDEKDEDDAKRSKKRSKKHSTKHREADD